MNYPSGEPPQAGWYYFQDGKNMGPAPADALAPWITRGIITGQTLVWRTGMAEWMPLGQTELAAMLAPSGQVEPLPTGQAIDNRLVWVIAFYPLFTLLLQFFFTGPIQLFAVEHWYLLWAVVIGLCWADLTQIKKAGCNTAGLEIWAILFVPVYLFMRAARLKQSNSYAFVNIASIVVSPIIATQMLLKQLHI